jgi:hypothetical protein
MGLLTEHLDDRREQAAFAFFEHATALMGDAALREFIEVIQGDVSRSEISTLIASRRSPEDRPGIQALLAALMTHFNVVNFSDSQFDLACVTLASMLKAGIPDDPEYIAKVAMHSDALTSRGAVKRTQAFYEKKFEDAGIIDEAGLIDADKMAEVVGETGGFIGWAASNAWLARSTASLVGVDRGLAILGKGAAYLQSAAQVPGMRGKAAALTLRGANAAINSTRITQLLRLGSRLKLGNPWVLAALTVGGYAAEYLLTDDAVEDTEEEESTDDTVIQSQVTEIEAASERGEQ